jgi:hypothetical protein
VNVGVKILRVMTPMRPSLYTKRYRRCLKNNGCSIREPQLADPSGFGLSLFGGVDGKPTPQDAELLTVGPGSRFDS